MNRIYLGAVLVAMSCVVGCQQDVLVHHDDDDYAMRYRQGWRRTIGTDHLAGNNEYLYFNDLPMEWSTNVPGSGYLYGNDPKSTNIVWSFSEHPKNSVAIPVKDGATLTVTHASGMAYDIEIVKQTKYYIKVFYKQQNGADDTEPPDER